MDIEDADPFELVEISFKNGSRKSFYKNEGNNRAITGDTVVVETGTGFDIGKVSLSGELVRLQMKKKRVDEEAIMYGIIRIANERDMERLNEARRQENKTMVRARAIARTLSLDMKIGDVEYQGDKRKATFYYTADGRVDFRELIRHFAKEFRVKIEMRQIGARQESARIGGLGSCGRELCCSTWLSDFKSVSTAAARYQNLAINQSKLSGQCGRLKCCLNYELDSYLDALDSFPKHAEKIATDLGVATLIKTDIFKGLLFYAYQNENYRGRIVSLTVGQVKELLQRQKAGEKIRDLSELQIIKTVENEEMEYEDVTGVIELPPEEKKRRNKKRRKPNHNNQGRSNPRNRDNNNKQSRTQTNKKTDSSSSSEEKKDDKGGTNKNKPNFRKNKRRNRGPRNNNNSSNNNDNKK
jgi:cell fate regulator YaaT (PSP1 superfamily)